MKNWIKTYHYSRSLDLLWVYVLWRTILGWLSSPVVTSIPSIVKGYCNCSLKLLDSGSATISTGM